MEAVQDLIEEEEDEDAFVPMAASAANSRPSSKRLGTWEGEWGL